MIPHRSATACLALIACAYAGSATAQNTDQWRVTVSPYVWATSLDGNITLAGHRAPVDVPFSDAFDQLESVVMGDVEVRKGRWGGYVDYQYAKTAEDVSLLGIPANLGTRTTTLSGGLLYRLIDDPLGGTLRTQVDAGGLGDNDRNSVSWQALASYRTPLGDGAVSVNAGYRLLQQNYEQDDFTGQRFDWKVSRHGPVLGLSLTY